MRSQADIEAAITDLVLWRRASDWDGNQVRRADRVIEVLEWAIGRRGDLAIHPLRITRPLNEPR